MILLALLGFGYLHRPLISTGESSKLNYFFVIACNISMVFLVALKNDSMNFVALSTSI